MRQKITLSSAEISSPIFPYQTFVTFPSLSYLPTLCCFINLSSSYQTTVIFSPFVFYSLFTLSTHHINAPAVNTTNTTLSLVLSCARSLRQYTFLTHQASLVIVPFWFGGIETWLGVLRLELSDFFQILLRTRKNSHSRWTAVSYGTWHRPFFTSFWTLSSAWQSHFGEIKLDNIDWVLFIKPSTNHSFNRLQFFTGDQWGRKPCCLVVRDESWDEWDSSFSLRILQRP